jgi:thioredoxin-like negative regulator of GroEL
MPIVHGLERQFKGRIDFLYIHVGEPRTNDVKTKLGFRGTPQIVLLRADGTKVREFVGVVEEAVLRKALDELVAPPAK